MKKVISLFCLLFSVLYSFAQEQKTKVEILEISEKMPEFPGGQDSMINYIGSKMVYPNSAIDKDLQGKVVVRFIVDETGKVIKCKVMESTFIENPKYKDSNLSYAKNDMVKEALRVVSGMPAWNPGFQKGKPVKVFFTLPITFKLTD